MSVRALWMAASVSLFGLMAGCVEELPPAVTLSPQGEQIELLDDRLPSDQYLEVGEIVGQGIGGNTREAELNASNDLRNRSATMGGTMVAIESKQTESYGYFTGKIRLEMHGIVYKLRE